jgi:hypothetical protein
MPAPEQLPRVMGPLDDGRGEPRPGQSRGWISDLLRRASDGAEPLDAPEDTAPRLPAALAGLAREIPAAIDGEAYEDLWERHRRGERKVFTRSLYTLRGQQTFDEVRRRYQREPEFRDAVDRFVRDFGRFAEAGGNADAGRLWSEDGRVYTMFAHASGKLD